MAARVEGPGPGPGEAAPQRLYLHVGLPKTGTTFLQTVLKHHRDVLEEHGFCYPFVRRSGMFFASVEMTRSARRWGLDPEDVEGTFDALLARGREHGGTVVLSHEGFGKATPEQVEEIRHRLEGFEVHVVLTVRDVGRTLTAEWQERIKNGGTRSFAEFAEMLADALPDGAAPAASFWTTQNVEEALERWRVVSPPERTHVVIAPHGGAPKDELWSRFGAAVGIPREIIDLDAVEVRNESLGAPQIAFLRRVHEAAGDRLPMYWVSRISKRWLAQELLSQVPSRKAVAPAETVARFEKVARRWADVVADGGYRTYGDLADLEVRTPPPGTPHPDDVTAEEVVEGLPEVVADLLVRVRELTEAQQAQRRRARTQAQRLATLRKQRAALRAELAEVRSELDDAREELRRRRRFWPFRVGPQKRT